MDTLVKICGIRGKAALAAALDAGADMVGFVRFARSPRHVSLDEGRALSDQARGRALRVLLLVDPADRDLDEAMAAIEPDVVQLHGQESPERVAAIRGRTGRPIMKALGIAVAADLARLPDYVGMAERILLDAKPPDGAGLPDGTGLPGGNGAAFDWDLLRALDAPGIDRRDLVLSGGLTAANVAGAIAATGLRAVDVSSGVECRPGEKSPEMIAAFVTAAHAAFGAAARNRTAA